MEKIIIASSNKGKIKEVKEILSDYEIISIDELNKKVDVEESEETFKGNAIKKAEETAKQLDGKLCMADDSGIEIEYLNGFPGVNTKRWLKGNDREKNLAILEKLQGVQREKRKLKFVVAIAISNGKKTICEDGIIEGFVAENIRGKNGFGFDEIFELENGKTLAELSEQEKNEISARKIALEKIKQSMENNF